MIFASDYKLMQKHFKKNKDKHKVNTIYLKNVQRSVKNLGKDINDEFSAPRENIKNTTTFIKKLFRRTEFGTLKGDFKRRMKKNETYQDVKTYTDNVKKGIKTGKFYRREDEIMDDLMDKMMKEWLDDSSVGDDVSLDSLNRGSNDGSIGVVKSNYDIASSSLESGAKNTEILATGTARQTEELKSSLGILTATNERYLGRMSESMVKLNDFFDKVQKDFIQTSTENQKQQITLLAEIRDLTKSAIEVDNNIAAGNAEVKKSFLDYALAGDFKGAFGKATRNLINEFDKYSVVSGIQDTLPTLMMMFKDNPFGFLKDMVMKKAGLDKLQKTVSPDKLLRDGLNRMVTSDSDIISRSGKALSKDPNDWMLNENNPGHYAKGKVHFDGIVRKSIVEVMPTYLRKILSAINGQDELVYNYGTGKFNSLGNMLRERKEILNKDIEGTGDLYEVTHKYLRTSLNYDKMNTAEQEKFRKLNTNLDNIIRVFLKDLSTSNLSSIDQVINLSYTKMKRIVTTSIDEDSFIVLKLALLRMRESEPKEFYALNEKLTDSLTRNKERVFKSFSELKMQNDFIGNVFTNDSAMIYGNINSGGIGTGSGTSNKKKNKKKIRLNNKSSMELELTT